MISQPTSAQQVYDRLWAEALTSFSAGSVRIDPFLLSRATDERRGITLIIRPDAAVIARIMDVIEQLREVAPEQHFYHPEELHITILSLIGVNQDFDLQKLPMAVYQSIFADVFSQVAPFKVHFRGLTASPDSILVQGYAADDALNQLRDKLREALHQAGLGSTLDRRYRTVTAHSTFMRFQAQPSNLPGLVDRLTSLREIDLGTFDVNQVEFVQNDWFMSRDRIVRLACYPLIMRYT